MPAWIALDAVSPGVFLLQGVFVLLLVAVVIGGAVLVVVWLLRHTLPRPEVTVVDDTDPGKTAAA